MKTPAMLLAIVMLAGVLMVPAAAYAASDPNPAPTSSDSPPLVWRWQRFRGWEYPATAAALVGATALRLAGPTPSADWTGGVLFDDWVQDHTAIQSLSGRQSVKAMTDVFFYGSMGYRIVDAAMLPSLVWRSPDVAFQMSMIDLESFSLVALTLWGSQALFGRERPYAKRCGDPTFAGDSCVPGSSEHNRSFFAGHPAVVLTAAGLTCTHHAHLPLYGGAWGDTLACGLMVGGAVITGMGRVMSEEHHASDLIVGYGVGVVAGFLMPEFLHYRHARPTLGDEPRLRDGTLVRAMLVPKIGQNELGVGLTGVF